jgi:hypothetical protein
VFSQFHHAVLHDVQCRFLVANVIDRAFEGPLFYAFQEFAKFGFSCQDNKFAGKAAIISLAAQKIPLLLAD